MRVSVSLRPLAENEIWNELSYKVDTRNAQSSFHSITHPIRGVEAIIIICSNSEEFPSPKIDTFLELTRGVTFGGHHFEDTLERVLLQE